MSRKLSLKTLNRWLRRIGLVLVLGIPVGPDGGRVVVWLEWARRYDARTQEQK